MERRLILHTDSETNYSKFSRLPIEGFVLSPCLYFFNLKIFKLSQLQVFLRTQAHRSTPNQTPPVRQILKVKGKAHPRTDHEGPEEEMRYSSTLFLTSALVGGRWSTPRSGHLTPGKEIRYPIYRRLGGPQGLSGRVRKIWPSPGFDPRNVSPLASRYTD